MTLMFVRLRGGKIELAPTSDVSTSRRAPGRTFPGSMARRRVRIDVACAGSRWTEVCVGPVEGAGADGPGTAGAGAAAAGAVAPTPAETAPERTSTISPAQVPTGRTRRPPAARGPRRRTPPWSAIVLPLSVVTGDSPTQFAPRRN